MQKKMQLAENATQRANCKNQILKVPLKHFLKRTLLANSTLVYSQYSVDAEADLSIVSNHLENESSISDSSVLWEMLTLGAKKKTKLSLSESNKTQGLIIAMRKGSCLNLSNSVACESNAKIKNLSQKVPILNKS